MGSDWSREEESRSELRVWVTVVSAAQWNLAGLHKYALHGLPQAVLAGARHGVNFPLTVDRTSILLPRHWQQRVGGLVAEADSLLALPYGSPALNCPLVQVVAFSFVTKCTHLLLTRGKDSKRQALEEKMRCPWFVKGTIYMCMALKPESFVWHFFTHMAWNWPLLSKTGPNCLQINQDCHSIDYIHPLRPRTSLRYTSPPKVRIVVVPLSRSAPNVNRVSSRLRAILVQVLYESIQSFLCDPVDKPTNHPTNRDGQRHNILGGGNKADRIVCVKELPHTDATIV